MSVDQRIISRNPATNEPIWSGNLADDAAIVQTVPVATQFGLAAGIVTRERTQYEAFYQQTKAGIINWNQPLTGATTAAPFGGAKASGNYPQLASCWLTTAHTHARRLRMRHQQSQRRCRLGWHTDQAI